MDTYNFQGLCASDYGIECGLGEINDLDTFNMSGRWRGKRATDCFSGTILEMPPPLPVMFVPVQAPGGFPGSRVLGRGVCWGLVHAMTLYHAGKVLGTMVAHDGGVVPPGSDAPADEEPEDAGGAAMEKDMLVRVHGRRWMMGGSISLDL